MAWWLRALAAFPENPYSIPSTHIAQLSRTLVLEDPMGSSGLHEQSMQYTDIHRHTCRKNTQTLKQSFKKNFFEENF